MIADMRCRSCGYGFTAGGPDDDLCGGCQGPPDWQPYRSVLACCYGVKNVAAFSPMSTFRPTDDWERAVTLAEQMNAAGYVGDGLDFVSPVPLGRDA